MRAGNGHNGQYLIGTTFWDTWSEFIDTYEGDENVWFEAERPDAFEWRGNEMIDFQGWQDRTGQDQNSVWRQPTDPDLSGR